MKNNNQPGNKPAPAKKAETTKHMASKIKNEAAARSRARRIRSMKSLGMSDEEILEVFNSEDVRTIMCLYYGSFTIEDGTVKKKVKKKEVEVPNILRGRAAAEKYLKDNNIKPIATGPSYCWIKTDKDNLNTILESLKPLGRTYVTKPEVATKESLEAKRKAKRNAESKAHKKPTNNTTEVKAQAKKARKKYNMDGAAMRPYYAAWRKGGISARIKKHNPTLADKIEKWLKERAAIEAKKAEDNKVYRAKHRQLTTEERKANKYARKEAKRKAAQERRRTQELKRMEHNAKIREKRAQKAQKPVQTELKMAA